MKKLLGIFMLAVMVTVGSAFTAADAPFATTILQRASVGSAWSPGSTVTCSGTGAACKVSFEELVDEDYFQSIGNAAPTSPGSPDTYPFGPFDHDNSAGTPDITITVSVVARFPQ